MTPMLSQDNALVQFLGGEFLNTRISNKWGGVLIDLETLFYQYIVNCF